MARQICIHEFELFGAIPLREFLVKSWAKADLQKGSPNVWNMIDRFNTFSSWVCWIIVSELTLKKRVTIVLKLIRLAKECMILNNFNAVFEITAGLQQNPVYRLKKTWDLVKKEKDYKGFEDMQSLISKVGNYAQYRDLLHNSDPPCIPYLGVYQTDLTFIQDGNPDYLDDGKITVNFFKRRLFAEVIKEIQTYQLKNYSFIPVELLMNWLTIHDTTEMTEESLYNMSLAVEPRDGNTVKGTKKLGALAPDGARPSSVNSELRDSSSSSKPKSKINKFFGEEVKSYQYNKKSPIPNSSGGSLVDDDSNPETIISPLELTPEQIDDYKRQMQQKYEEEKNPPKSKEQQLEELQAKLGELDDLQL